MCVSQNKGNNIQNINEILPITKLISNKGYVQILGKDMVWDTVNTNRVFDRVIICTFQNKDTGQDTVWDTRVINHVMQHFNKISILESQTKTRVETRFRLPV